MGVPLFVRGTRSTALNELNECGKLVAEPAAREKARRARKSGDGARRFQ